MAVVPDGLAKILSVLRGNLAKIQAASKTQTIVGFSAPYALSVHEDEEMIHPHGGQAKFLEEPMKLYRKQMSDRIKLEMKNGKTLPEAQLIVANILLEEAKKLVPVDTGFLRDSGFVKQEG